MGNKISDIGLIMTVHTTECDGELTGFRVYLVTLHGTNPETQKPSEMTLEYTLPPELGAPCLEQVVTSVLTSSDLGELEYPEFARKMHYSAQQEDEGREHWEKHRTLPNKLATLLSPGQWRRVRDILGVE